MITQKKRIASKFVPKFSIKFFIWWRYPIEAKVKN
ncbi:hypothetical protein VIBC2010_05334 [Vibrio caribbeanicus ATCC BAA-2122]|uniref:Uncharacterized protein n=1 Tax=Vibrio caribbeanicus ATCC BAA-2122 TaxID=796620 RepID=E3BKI6_9VIBR|nr:hypothetical protein VIBC2010_05334 [Vibrio caribbeanicus ATCC BAA-2122]